MAQLRAAVGQAEESVELPDGNSLADLLNQLATTHSAARSHFVTETGHDLCQQLEPVATLVRDQNT